VPKLKSLLYCGYDDKGDLFVDGYNGTQFGLSELAAHASGFMRVKLDQAIEYGGQIQWDGTDLAVETQIDPAIERVQISGSDGTVVGTVKPRTMGHRATQSWIANGTIAVPTGPGNRRAIEILFWRYPAGGRTIGAFRHFVGGRHQTLDGVTFSQQSRQQSKAHPYNRLRS
jgi:hypothetical protein